MSKAGWWLVLKYHQSVINSLPATENMRRCPFMYWYISSRLTAEWKIEDQKNRNLVSDSQRGSSSQGSSGSDGFSQQRQVILVDGCALGVGDRFEVGHPFEANPVEVLGAGVPDDVGGRSGTGGWPVLDFSDLASSTVAAILEKPKKFSANHN